MLQIYMTELKNACASDSLGVKLVSSNYSQQGKYLGVGLCFQFSDPLNQSFPYWYLS